MAFGFLLFLLFVSKEDDGVDADEDDENERFDWLDWGDCDTGFLSPKQNVQTVRDVALSTSLK